MLPIINFDNSNNLMPCELRGVGCGGAGVVSGGSKRRGSAKSMITNQWLMCSQQSILSAMNRFVASVNNMDATVLVPSKLRDMEIAALRAPPRLIPSALANTDLHSFYQMLNDVKKELLWGGQGGTIITTQASHHPLQYLSNGLMNRSNSISSSNTTTTSSSLTPTPNAIKHSQCQSQSEDSLGSLGSSASSSVSDTESDADSMITDRDSIDDQSSHLAVAFRHHLHGLHSILHQLADSADYLSFRYQEEIEDL